MKEELTQLLATLTTPGKETSEGKLTRNGIIGLFLVLVVEIGHHILNNSNTTGTITVILGTVLAIILKSGAYVAKRSAVKTAVAQTLGSSEVMAIIRDIMTPPAAAPRMELATRYAAPDRTAIPAAAGAASPFQPINPGTITTTSVPPVKPQPRKNVRRPRSGFASPLLLCLLSALAFLLLGCETATTRWTFQGNWNPQTGAIGIGVGKEPISTAVDPTK